MLRRGGVAQNFRRPEGAAGQQLTAWLWPEQATALIGEAVSLIPEFGTCCIVLLYTGLRLSEGLRSEIDRLGLDEGYLYMPRTKNGQARAVFLPAPAIEALREHPRGLKRPGAPIFKFHKGGHLYSLLRAAAARAGVTLEERQAFHVFCHTYGTWMRRYGGLDLRGLVGTDRWKDIESTAHYATSYRARKPSGLPLLPGLAESSYGRLVKIHVPCRAWVMVFCMKRRGLLATSKFHFYRWCRSQWESSN